MQGDSAIAVAGPTGPTGLTDEVVSVDPDDTGARLVRAAIEVFAEKGYDGAGVAEIARRAGLSTGAIYSRFTGKAELLAEAIAAVGGDELDRLFARAVDGTPLTDVLAAIGSHLVTDEGSMLSRSLLLEAFTAARRDPEVAVLLRSALELRATQLGVLIDDAKAAGLVDPALDTAAVVHFAHAIGLGFVLFGAVGADNPAVGAWDELIARLLAAVRPATSAI